MSEPLQQPWHHHAFCLNFLPADEEVPLEPSLDSKSRNCVQGALSESSVVSAAHCEECVQVVVASHSWGDNVFRNFLVWVTEDDPDWVEKHIQAYVNIAGPVLGVAKSMTSLLSGLLMTLAHLHGSVTCSQYP